MKKTFVFSLFLVLLMVLIGCPNGNDGNDDFDKTVFPEELRGTWIYTNEGDPDNTVTLTIDELSFTVEIKGDGDPDNDGTFLVTLTSINRYIVPPGLTVFSPEYTVIGTVTSSTIELITTGSTFETLISIHESKDRILKNESPGAGTYYYQP